MELSGIKAVTIPQGDVKSIAVGGVTIWRKAFAQSHTPIAPIETGGFMIGGNQPTPTEHEQDGSLDGSEE